MKRAPRRSGSPRASPPDEKPDVYALYEASTQSPQADVAFIEGIYRRRHRTAPRSLREDFCGSAALSRAFVARGAERRAMGIDLNAGAIAKAAQAARRELDESALARLELLRGDVRRAPSRARVGFDLAVAYNFSYCVFKKRGELLEYFSGVHRALSPRGMFFLDLFGGMTAEQPSLETREHEGFTYIWEQESFDPLTRTLRAYIHFQLDDGRLIKRAFRYDWRLWQIVELREALEEAGFRSSDVYWEDRDEEGFGTHRFRRRTRVEAEPSWTAYLVASR